jgi:hypothetical protein
MVQVQEALEQQVELKREPLVLLSCIQLVAQVDLGNKTQEEQQLQVLVVLVTQVVEAGVPK